MITNKELLVLMRAAAALAKVLRTLTGELAQEAETALNDLNETVTANLQTRAATGERLSKTTNGRPPSVSYRIEVSNMAPRVVLGTSAAVEAVNEVLREHGVRALVTSSSLSVGIARNGQWFKLIETSNGTVVVSATKVTESA